MDFKTLPFLLILIHSGRTQDPNCSFNQTVQVGQTYTLNSPNYPYNYEGANKCKWMATCPRGYRCHLNCPDINLPESSNCRADHLTVSRTGSSRLLDGSRYCGRKTLDVLSLNNRISVELISPDSTSGGRFACELSAQRAINASLCSCGVRRQGRQGRIVGGQETGVNEYTMMAGVVDAQIAQIKCGGVIISNKHVLTSANCVQDQALNNYVVVVGEHNTTSNTDTNATRAYRVARIDIHPNFSSDTLDYDAAILTVQGTITFNDRVGPVCLPFRYAAKNFTGSNVTLLGWGTLFSGGPKSDTLQKVDVKVISQAECRGSRPGLTNSQLCTYTAGKDACQFDEGGPLLYTDPSTGFLYNVGIISNGRSCASRQNLVSTRVTAIIDWIIATTGNIYCIK